MSVISKIKNFEYKEFFSQLYKRIFEEDILNSGAQVAFYFTFALFPFLLFLISLLGIVLVTTDDFRREFFFYLRQIMPSSAYELVNTTIKEVTENSSGGKLTFGILVALWSASAGIDSIRVALNSVYNLVEKRPYWKTKLLSLALTLALIIFVIIALGIVLYGSQFVSFVLTTLSIPVPSPFALGILQFFTILIVLLLSFALIYNFCPSYQKSRWVWISPGAVTGIILWLLLSAAFRLYLKYFDTYAKTYGSLGAVIVLLLWLYLTAVVILVGGLINSIFEEMSQNNDLTEGDGETNSGKKGEETKKDPENGSNNGSKQQGKTIQAKKKEENINRSNDDEEDVNQSKENKKDVNQSKENKVSVKVNEMSATQNKVQAEVVDANDENSIQKPIVNLTIGTVFGMILGLFFKRKKD